MGGRALTPPTRHRLGRPLPYQQADRTQAPPKAGSYALYSCKARENLNFQIPKIKQIQEIQNILSLDFVYNLVRQLTA
ncbi:hypothetical protein A2160_04175 [Candidatus Beckwithbacteria bacterium RBG_13_42_9]|uniref:Uncharacterized protein n=1 Tax=Candidatus Beckwithbacteria bacterium RBG_13_42_9 TaxID=1797457 RepID=A0A1F5E6K3_9BACT|nr:MAG: hypothetical protein A2160_04175 [Candidatus Beckwithbacteria bacterium RBG_13_42_9]